MHVLIDMVDPRSRDEVVHAVRGIVLGEFDLVATVIVVDGADLGSRGVTDLHMLGDPVDQAAGGTTANESRLVSEPAAGAAVVDLDFGLRRTVSLISCVRSCPVLPSETSS